MRNEQQNRRKASNSSGYSSRLESLSPQDLERRRRGCPYPSDKTETPPP